MTLAVHTKQYRPFLLDQGDQLIISRDAMTTATRLLEFVDTTGLKPELLVADPVVALPLPLHFPGNRFEDVHPHALWHPLFWLPQDIALRVRISESEHAEPRPETEAEWAVRIAIELSTSGLYSPDYGWVDIFALYGIDVDDPMDLDAIVGWQAGLPDERLDRINLHDHFTFAPNNEAFYAAQELYPLAMSAQWSLTAASLLAAVEEDPERAGIFAALAADMLSAAPTDSPDELQSAHTEIEAGADPASQYDRIVHALNSVVVDYANSVYELDQLLHEDEMSRAHVDHDIDKATHGS